MRLSLALGVLGDEMLKNVTYINQKTGEFRDVKQKIIPDVFNDQGYLFRTRQNSIKLFAAAEFPLDFSFIDAGRTLAILRYTYHGTNCLATWTRSGVISLTTRDIANIIELSPRQAATFIKRLKETRILLQVPSKKNGKRNSEYFVNPIYCLNGNRISLNLYQLFKNDLDLVLPKWVIGEFANMERCRLADTKGSEGVEGK